MDYSMDYNEIYKNIAGRTDNDIYIGVVGPVRTGKSTFIKRFCEAIILPNIKNDNVRARTIDELPQSSSGRTIMTTEPKFIPERAINIDLEEGVSFNARLVDCVGYMVKGAIGAEEGSKPRLVKSPWYNEEVPFDVAAETGTKKVITDHSTIGVVVTTDGSISDIQRASYEAAEQRVIEELKAIGKPFIVILNCVSPSSKHAIMLSEELSQRYNCIVMPVNCLELDYESISRILAAVLYEFPLKEIKVFMPKWVTMLEPNHWLQNDVYGGINAYAAKISKIKDVAYENADIVCEHVNHTELLGVDLAIGSAKISLELAGDVFYKVLGETTGLEIVDEASLMPCIINLAKTKAQFEKIKAALEQVEATGYGIVMPNLAELTLEEPEIVKQGGRYGVRLKASAPSIHMMKANITTEVSPIVGSEKQSEELVLSLLKEFEEDPIKIWDSNIFGKSLHQLVNDGLHSKLLHMPQDARDRLQETVERIINEGCQGLICIII